MGGRGAKRAPVTDTIFRVPRVSAYESLHYVLYNEGQYKPVYSVAELEPRAKVGPKKGPEKDLG